MHNNKVLNCFWWNIKLSEFWQSTDKKTRNSIIKNIRAAIFQTGDESRYIGSIQTDAFYIWLFTSTLMIMLGVTAWNTLLESTQYAKWKISNKLSLTIMEQWDVIEMTFIFQKLLLKSTGSCECKPVSRLLSLLFLLWSLSSLV